MELEPSYLNTAVLAVLAWAIRALYNHVSQAVHAHQTAVAEMRTRLAIIEYAMNHVVNNGNGHSPTSTKPHQ